MKFPQLLLLGFVVFWSCQSQVEEKKKNDSIFDEGPVTVAGKLKNWSKKKVELALCEPTEEKWHKVWTDAEGNFQFKVDIVSSHNSGVWIGKEVTGFFLNPNDSIYITADVEDFKNTLQFTGDNMDFNVTVAAFFSEFRKIYRPQQGFWKQRKSETPEQYKETMSDFIGQLKSKKDSIITARKSSEFVSGWLDTYLKYREAIEILIYIKKTKHEIPDGYCFFDTPEFLERDKKDFLVAEYYDLFLRKYFMDYKFEKIKGYNEIRSRRYNEVTYNSVKDYFEFIDKHMTDSLYKNLYLTNQLQGLFQTERAIADSLESLYLTFVTDSICRKTIQKEKNNEKPAKVKTLDELTKLTHLGEIFTEIQKKSEGKLIYFDVWAPWCGGCVKALPHTNKLSKKFKGKDIEFVYLCLVAEKDTWQRIVSEKKLGGMNYLLNRKQTNELDSIELIGTPRYFLIGKSGEIIDYYATKPYSDSVEEELLNRMKE